MKEEDRNALERYIEKVLESRDPAEARAIPDEDDYRSLAVKYGLDETIWDRLSQEREAHETRGRLFVREENWDEAIAELEQAFVIAPYDSSLAFDLGQAFARRFEERREPDDKRRAERLFRRCLAGDPAHAAAVAELSKLARLPRRGGLKAITPGSAALLCFALGLIIAGALWRQGDPPAVLLPPEETPPKPHPDLEIEPTRGRASPFVIPVDFPIATPGRDLVFDLRSSILTRYEDKFAYEMKGILRVESGEVRRLEGELDLLGADGNVKAVAPFRIIASHQPNALEGDSIPVSVLIFREERAPDSATARMRVTLFEGSPLSGPLDPDPEIPFSTGSLSLPPNASIAVRRRLLTSGTTALFPSETTVNMVITVENTGKRPITSLEFNASAEDHNGEIIPTTHHPMFRSLKTSFPASMKPGDLWIVRSTEPSMKPGERRVAVVNLYLPDASPDDFRSVDLSLVRIE